MGTCDRVTVCSCPAGTWLYTASESKFAYQVHAVAVLPNCAPKAGLPEHGAPIAAVGKRLVTFGSMGGHLWKPYLIDTSQPATCLSPHPSIKGDFVISNSTASLKAVCLVTAVSV